MSELKAFDITLAEEGYCEGIVKYRRAVYDKSEADKLIAELKADYKEACDRLQTANLIKDEQLAATSHSNHKRCLAMAKVCYLRFIRYENYLQKLCASNATIAAYKFRRDLYDKWENRWLELAKEPTWAKFLQLIHREDGSK